MFQRRVYVELSTAIYESLIAQINAGEIDGREFYAHRVWNATDIEIQRKSVDGSKVVLEIPSADFYVQDDPDYMAQDTGVIMDNMKNAGYIIEWYVHPMDGEIPFLSPDERVVCDRNILDVMATTEYTTPMEE